MQANSTCRYRIHTGAHIANNTLAVNTLTPMAVNTLTPMAVNTVTPMAVNTVTPMTVNTVTPMAVNTVTPMAVNTVTPMAVNTTTHRAEPCDLRAEAVTYAALLINVGEGARRTHQVPQRSGCVQACSGGQQCKRMDCGQKRLISAEALVVDQWNLPCWCNGLSVYTLVFFLYNGLCSYSNSLFLCIMFVYHGCNMGA